MPEGTAWCGSRPVIQGGKAEKNSACPDWVVVGRETAACHLPVRQRMVV